MKYNLSKHARLALGALAVVAAVAACDDGEDPLGPATAVGAPNMVIASGNDQQSKVEDPALRPLANPLRVLVATSGGAPIAGASVTFTVLTGGGSIAGSPATSDANGYATSGTWTLGPSLGFQTARAQYVQGNDTARVTFTARGLSVCDDRVAIAPSVTASGTLAPTDCVTSSVNADHFNLATAGAYNIAVTSSAFTPRLQILDALGLVVSADTTSGSPATIFRVVVPANTTIRVMGTSAASAGAYTVDVTPVSADVSGCQATNVIIAVGATSSQTIAAGDCTRLPGTGAQWEGNTGAYPGDNFRVWLIAGRTYRFRESQTVVDGWTELFNPAGTRVAQNDDAASGFSEITYAVPAGGTGWYTIFASAYGLAANNPYGHEYGAYTINVAIP